MPRMEDQRRSPSLGVRSSHPQDHTWPTAMCVFPKKGHFETPKDWGGPTLDPNLVGNVSESAFLFRSNKMQLHATYISKFKKKNRPSFEEGQHLVSGDDQRIQDLTEILQRHGDGRHEALDDHVVHEVHVGLPGGRRLGDLQGFTGILHEASVRTSEQSIKSVGWNRSKWRWISFPPSWAQPIFFQNMPKKSGPDELRSCSSSELPPELCGSAQTPGELFGCDRILNHWAYVEAWMTLNIFTLHEILFSRPWNCFFYDLPQFRETFATSNWHLYWPPSVLHGHWFGSTLAFQHRVFTPSRKDVADLSQVALVWSNNQRMSLASQPMKFA